MNQHVALRHLALPLAARQARPGFGDALFRQATDRREDLERVPATTDVSIVRAPNLDRVASKRS